MKNHAAIVRRRAKMTDSEAQKRHGLQFGKRFSH
jgi:hypothetical protein